MQYHRIGIAKRLILAKKFKQAKALLMPFALKGNVRAQMLLGYLYFGGDTNTSARQAESWLRKSARKGNADAMAMLAEMDFKHGFRSSEAQTPLMIKAALNGSAEAQRSLACSYVNSHLVDKNITQAMYWDEKAAQQGLAESQHDLALMLLHGMTGEVDVSKAIYWYQQSAAKDCNVPYAEWAAEALARIYRGIPDQKFRDDELAQYWRGRAQYLSTLAFRPHPDWFYK